MARRNNSEGLLPRHPAVPCHTFGRRKRAAHVVAPAGALRHGVHLVANRIKGRMNTSLPE